MWDVHTQARTEGSLDRELHDCAASDVRFTSPTSLFFYLLSSFVLSLFLFLPFLNFLNRQLIQVTPSIKRIVFNSRQAAVDFMKHYRDWLAEKPCQFQFDNTFAKEKFSMIINPPAPSFSSTSHIFSFTPLSPPFYL